MITALEARRQVFHMLLGMACAFGLFWGIFSPFLFGAGLVVGLVVYLINISRPIGLLQPLLKGFEREEDYKTRPGFGALMLVSGVFLSSLFFERAIASAAIMVLALGDSVAPLVGHMGKLRHPLSNDPKKLLEGALAGLIAAFLGCLLFVSWPLAAVGSIVGMILEAIDLRLHREIDDNIMIPLGAGLAMLLLSFIM
ncbi:MAG: hypothetical protein ABIC95_07350 [archaeon]